MGSRALTTLALCVFLAAEETSLEQGLKYERKLFWAMFGTEDQKEGASGRAPSLPLSPLSYPVEHQLTRALRSSPSARRQA